MSQSRWFENRQPGYRDRYLMEFRDEGDHWTIWCHAHPPDPHGKSASEGHLLASGKLCQRSGHESTTLEHAEAFAHWWMERWSVYVRTGTFPMTPGTVHVPE
jgi:hypothetical protein